MGVYQLICHIPGVESWTKHNPHSQLIPVHPYNSRVPVKLTKGPLVKLPKATVTLTNTSNGPILFKIKTTNPKSYLINPNNGELKKDQKIEIKSKKCDYAVSILNVSQEPPLDAVCKDKFLVQAVFMPNSSGSTSPISQSFEELAKICVFEHKLRAMYVNDASSEAITDESPKISSSSASIPVSRTTASLLSPLTADAASAQPHNSDSILSLKSSLKTVEAQALEYKKKYNEALEQINLLSEENRSLRMDKQKITSNRHSSSADALLANPSFPPVLIGMIALFSFLIGLIF